MATSTLSISNSSRGYLEFVKGLLSSRGYLEFVKGCGIGRDVREGVRGCGVGKDVREGIAGLRGLDGCLLRSCTGREGLKDEGFKGCN